MHRHRCDLLQALVGPDFVVSAAMKLNLLIQFDRIADLVGRRPVPIVIGVMVSGLTSGGETRFGYASCPTPGIALLTVRA